MTHDPHRPLYHFSPDQWMNDPIPFFWDGAYHVYFQHNPHGAFWGDMHWGHALSRDLAHWEQLPIALAPTPDSPDSDGCFTGCVVEHGGLFFLFYTGIPRLEPLQQVQCLATSTDLTTWVKHVGNPLIAEMPPGTGPCFRDPQVWCEGDDWLMTVGSEQPERRGGLALLYQSRDLYQWDALPPLARGEIAQTGHEFECPDFFPLDDRHVLLTSSHKTWWHTGDYADRQFTASRWGLMDGGAFYAAKTLMDASGRRLLFGWVQETRSVEEQKAAGWSGVLSLPRVLSVLPDGALGVAPAPELHSLRGRHQQFGPLTVSDGALLLEGSQGDALEVLIRFAPSDAASFGAVVRSSPDGEERVELLYDRAAQSLNGTPLVLASGEGLTLHIYVDRSVIEVFANDRTCHTHRVYSRRADCLSVGLLVLGGSVRVEAVDVWEMELV